MTWLENTCFCLALFATFAAVAHGAESGKIKALDPADTEVKKLVVTRSQIGYRSTLLFFTFHDQKAVLRVSIDNKNTAFPVAATVFTFADDATDEGLAKWLNNQHSDGIYPDVPEPVAIGNLPAESCKVVSHKFVGKEKQSFGNFDFDNYLVEFQVSGVPELNGVQVKDFKESVNVYVKPE